LLAVVAVVCSTAVIAGVARSDPAGTTTLASGTSARPKEIKLVGGSSQGAVFEARDVSADGRQTIRTELLFKPASGPMRSLYAGPALGTIYVNWPFAVASRFDTDVVQYWNLGNDSLGTGALADGEQVAGASPAGWIVAKADPNTQENHLYDITAASGARRDLGAPPGWAGDVLNGLLVGPQGFAVKVFRNDIEQYLYATYDDSTSYVHLDLDSDSASTNS
jgi:hypothetical protein